MYAIVVVTILAFFFEASSAPAQEDPKATFSTFDRTDWTEWSKIPALKGAYSAGYLDGITTGLYGSSSSRRDLLDCFEKRQFSTAEVMAIVEKAIRSDETREISRLWLIFLAALKKTCGS